MGIAEMGPAIRGVVDVLQHGEVVSHNYGLNRSSRLLSDAAGYCIDRQRRMGESYDVKIYYQDGTFQDSRKSLWYEEDKVPVVIWEGIESNRIECSVHECSYQMQIGRLRVENIFGEKKIKNVQILDRQGQEWNSNIEDVLEVDYTINCMKKKNGLLLEFPLRVQDGQFMSIQLSCHDNGWEHFPEEDNPYGAQGSRYIAGYTTLLAPAIPVFMSGEEFNADYRPIPWLSPNLFGGEPLGKGRWLYGSWIEWEQLKIPEKAQMLEDFKCMLHIRNTYLELIKAFRMGDMIRNFGAINYESINELPIPYYYKGNRQVLVIAANPDRERDVRIRLQLETVLDLGGTWNARVLFGSNIEEKEIEATAQEFAHKEWKIKKDCVRQGGLLVIRFER